MPSSTSGAAKPEYCGWLPEPRSRARHTPLSCATLPRLIAVSGDQRWLARLPPLVGQAADGGAANAAPEKRGWLSRVDCADPVATKSAASVANPAADRNKRMIPPTRVVRVLHGTPWPSRLLSSIRHAKVCRAGARRTCL